MIQYSDKVFFSHKSEIKYFPSSIEIEAQIFSVACSEYVLFYYLWLHTQHMIMINFFEGMDPLLQGFWYVALISSLIFVIQTIMTFAGSGDTDGINADFDGDLAHTDAPFQMFTLRNLVNFMLGFGWAGIAFYSSVSSKALLIILAIVVGAAFVGLFFLVIRQLLKLTEDNTFDINQLLHKTGEVYLFIPEHLTGRGKVQISHKGTNHELDAMTEGERIPSGSVVIVGRIEQNILIVKTLS